VDPISGHDAVEFDGGGEYDISNIGFGVLLGVSGWSP